MKLEVTCPYEDCKAITPTLWDPDDVQEERECVECGGVFALKVDYSISVDTEPLGEGQ